MFLLILTDEAGVIMAVKVLLCVYVFWINCDNSEDTCFDFAADSLVE